MTTRILYCNSEPHDVAASLRLDDDPWAPTIIPGTGSQHIEFAVPVSEVGHGATLRCEAPGYVPLEARVLMADPATPDDVQLKWADSHLPVDVVLVPVPPVVVALPRLVVNGQMFGLETGERWTAIEASDFHLFGRFMNGEDIAPVLQQRAELGFNLLRVWTRYDLAQYGIGRCTLADHPDLYDRLPAFLDLCTSFGLYVELTAYTGREDYDPQHWGRLGDAVVKAQTRPLLELVNEQDQPGNSINLLLFEPLDDVWCSRGSRGSEQPPVGFISVGEGDNAHIEIDPKLGPWHYATFHTNSAPQWWRKNGHNAMEIWGGPTLTNESTRCPDQDSSPQHYQDAAAGAALLCAGSCFHSVHGKSSELFTGQELICAQAHVVGARSVPLGCQPFVYRHRSDLEGGSYLRVYQRGSEPVCIVPIRF